MTLPFKVSVYLVVEDCTAGMMIISAFALTLPALKRGKKTSACHCSYTTFYLYFIAIKIAHPSYLTNHAINCQNLLINFSFACIKFSIFYVSLELYCVSALTLQNSHVYIPSHLN